MGTGKGLFFKRRNAEEAETHAAAPEETAGETAAPASDKSKSGKMKDAIRQARTAAGEAARKPFEFVSEFSGAVASSDVLKAAWEGVRPHLVFIVCFSAAINLLYLAPSLFMLQVYDRVLPTGGILTLLLLGVVLVVSLTVMAFLDAMRARLLARVSLRFERLAANAIVRESLTARRSGQAQPGAAGIRELDTLRTGISSPATLGMLDLPWAPLFIAVCFMLHFWIGVLAMAGAVLIFALALINERASRSNLAAVSSKAPYFYVAHDSDLNSSETIHALGAEEAITRRRLKVRDDLVDVQTAAAFDNAGYSAATKSARLMLQSAALGLGAFLAVERQISPGAIIAASILTARAFAPVEQIVAGWRQFGMGMTALTALRKMFEMAAPRADRTPLPVPAGHIRVESVAAAAPGARVIAIQGVSLQAAPGEIVGIIGPSGAGKSTLARVLANAAPPLQGAIRIDGARYSDWEPRALSEHIGYLPQRIDLFDGTVSDNISCFARDKGESMDEVGPKVVEAAIMAGAHEMILGLPNGYEAQLGLNGGGVSPGQAQRIALARALYGNPKVVVLDEPNSHLDNEGEAALVQALLTLKNRKVVSFIVAHRAGVIGIVDKILILREGRVLEYGPRDEVLAKMQQPQRPPSAPANRNFAMSNPS